MSKTIDERIENHDIAIVTLTQKRIEYEARIKKIDAKLGFHRSASENLNKKKEKALQTAQDLETKAKEAGLPSEGGI